MPPLQRAFPAFPLVLFLIERLAGIAMCLDIVDKMRLVQAFAIGQPLVCRHASHLTFCCIASHGWHLHFLRPAASHLSTKDSQYNINVGISNRHTRLNAFEGDFDVSSRNSSLGRIDGREKHFESASLTKFLDNAEKRMKLLEKKTAARSGLRSKLIVRMKRVENSLDQVRPGIKRIVLSPKLIAFGIATCLFAVPAGAIFLSVVAIICLVKQALSPLNRLLDR